MIEVKLENLHLFRQIIATFTSSLLSMSIGFTFGQSGVLLPQLKDDQDFPYDEDYDSWIASISPLAMTLGCIFAGAMSDGLGRKNGQLVITPLFALGWFVMGFAKDNILILLGRFITGICAGAVRPCSMVYIGEITSPKYRSITLICLTLAVQIGITVSHLLGNTLPWRISCFVFGIPNIICFFIVIFLTESPLWLIEKGRIEEGLKSFRFFRGEEEAAEKELTSIIQKREQKSNETSVKVLFRTLFSSMFIKALGTIFFLFCTSQLSGVNMIAFYTLTLFDSLFGDFIDPFTLTLIIDFLRIVAALIVCLFANTFPRRITFLVCCFGITILLILLSVYFFLKPAGLSWLCLCIFISYVMAANSTLTLSWPFVTEIFPNSLRGFGSGLGTAICSMLLFISVKVTPEILKSYGDAIMYAIYSAITFVNFIFLYFMLPETDGKTLQDIENSLYGNKDEKPNLETCNTRI